LQKAAAYGLGLLCVGGAAFVGGRSLDSQPAPRPTAAARAVAQPTALLGGPTAKASRSQAPPQSGPVSINSASASELESLPGVGPVIARRIVDYRVANGGFKSVDELEAVKGIGPKTLAKIRPYAKL
jgi:competence protein ComEA